MVKKANIGLIAYANDGGLGAQTRRLAQMIKPHRILVIDSSNFSPNRKQNFDWYGDFNYFVTRGFPTNKGIEAFLPNLTHVFTCENPYNFNLIYWGQQRGIKVYCQSNYEFCDNLDKMYLPVPDKFLMPSYWKLTEMKKLFGEDRVEYLPPPINPDEFKIPRRKNLKRTGKVRFLHVIGTLVSDDRNGTLDLLEAVKLSKSDFELVIHTQHPLPIEYFLDDKRITNQQGNLPNNSDLYHDFDALILPRRFGGLSLTTNEALMSALPVIMTDVSPNNEWLPREWMVKSTKKGSFFARSSIDLYSVDHKELADRVDWFCSLSREEINDRKIRAFQIAQDNVSEEVLKPRYNELFRSF